MYTLIGCRNRTDMLMNVPDCLHYETHFHKFIHDKEPSIRPPSIPSQKIGSCGRVLTSSQHMKLMEQKQKEKEEKEAMKKNRLSMIYLQLRLYPVNCNCNSGKRKEEERKRKRDARKEEVERN